MTSTVFFGDNLNILRRLPDESVDLIYIDPPFNTGKVQARKRLKTTRDVEGDRVGFGENNYRTELISEQAYGDSFSNYQAFLMPRMQEAHRLLKAHGSLYFHIDYREVHYCKIMLDQIFGRENFLNEIIWAYDYGGRAKNKWPAKHDNILYYAKDHQNYVFNRDAIDREPYMAPGLVGKEKAARGKLPTDTWWHTIVGTNSREKTGYPTQKPVAILERILRASSNPGDLVLDFFAGSGSTGQACLNLGRRFILIDNNPQALETMRKRFDGIPGIAWELEADR
ncbi:MAG: site-specific DNA-methyltransferase [Anaerolineaceae bacterium]|nr:site-specific DNA-methyltransferase [Anaerolineaceae bacterium]HOG77655.1 site-specific DNA-methyltransferase [Anaerolineaceae bacterium]